MSGRADMSGSTNRREMMLIALSVYLIGALAWRLFIPAHEYPMRNEQVLTMVLDFGIIVGLFGLKAKLTTLQLLSWIGIVCGVGLFVIRLTGDSAWWTGHLMYSLH